MFGLFKKSPQKPPDRFPPVPDWQPQERQPLERLDMHPLAMDDGNILVRYNHDMASIVLEDMSSSIGARSMP